MKTDDVTYMQLALLEAEKGLGRTSPNPCVGAIVVKNGEVVGRGYHKKAGTPHAEVHALADAGDNCVGSTIYVTLEPCSHYGKTPPCCEAVAAAGIKRVVIGMLDPNPLVNGRGVQFLKGKNLEVVSGICEDDCVALNRPFIKMVTTGLPWVVMKAGVSLDGRLNYQKGLPGWITGPESKAKVHQLRDRVDAIMVGSSTVKIDNPSLTTRLNNQVGKNPIRVVLDTHLATDIKSTVYQIAEDQKTFVFCGAGASKEQEEELVNLGVNVFRIPLTTQGKLDLTEVMKSLVGRGVNSVLVEGGATLHGHLIKEKLYDYAYLFYAPVFAGSGGVSLIEGCDVQTRAERVCLENPSYSQFGNDMLVEGFLFR